MKKKRNWTFKSKHVLIAMGLICISLMIFAAAVKFPVAPIKMRQAMSLFLFRKELIRSERS